MKKLYFLLFLNLSFLSAFGQFGPYTINFDTTGIPWQQHVFIDTVNYHHNLWQVGRPHKTIFDSAYSYANVIVTDTANLCAANDTSVFIVKISGSQFGWIHHVEFRYKMDIDTGGSKGMVDVSIDSVNWSPINGLGNYFQADTPSLLSPTQGWAYYSIGHDFGFCNTFYTRFTFISDTSSNLREGWMIDDIAYTYFYEGISSLLSSQNTLSIYPNPATDKLNISSKTKMSSISVINTIGQIVLTKTCNSNHEVLDIQQLPKGLYCIKADDGSTSRFLK